MSNQSPKFIVLLNWTLIFYSNQFIKMTLIDDVHNDTIIYMNGKMCFYYFNSSIDDLNENLKFKLVQIKYRELVW